MGIIAVLPSVVVDADFLIVAKGIVITTLRAQTGIFVIIITFLQFRHNGIGAISISFGIQHHELESVFSVSRFRTTMSIKP